MQYEMMMVGIVALCILAGACWLEARFCCRPQDDLDGDDNDELAGLRSIIEGLEASVDRERATNKRLCDEAVRMRAAIRRYGFLVEELEDAMERFGSGRDGSADVSGMAGLGVDDVSGRRARRNDEDGRQGEDVPVGRVGPCGGDDRFATGAGIEVGRLCGVSGTVPVQAGVCLCRQGHGEIEGQGHALRDNDENGVEVEVTA